MTPEDYRRLALSLPGTIESSHHDHPDFRIGGRIFATIWKDNGVILLSPDQQSQLVDSNPNIFTPVKGGWGKNGSTTVHLDTADEASVRQALSIAYTNKISKKQVEQSMGYSVRELSLDTWPDFEKLALKQGGCWCMYYQREKPLRSHGEELKKANRRDKKALVRNGRSHAILVYSGDTPVGWCQYGIREELPRIDNGRGYKKLGPPKTAEKLWRITCFYVDRAFRGKGVSKFALKAALNSIKQRGGGIVEAYPVVSKKMAAVPEWRWFGTPGMFEKEGFEHVGPLGNTWTLMRKTVSP